MEHEPRKPQFSRREIERPVSIKLSIPAVLLDISRSGARLSIDSSAIIPDEFILELSAELHRWCQGRSWRSEKQVGVQYVSLPKATPDSKGIEPLLAGKAEI